MTPGLQDKLVEDAVFGTASSRRFRQWTIALGSLVAWLNASALALLLWSGPGAARSVDYYLDRPAAVVTGADRGPSFDTAVFFEEDGDAGDDHWLVSRRWSHPTTVISCGVPLPDVYDEEGEDSVRALERIGVLAIIGDGEYLSLSGAQ